jgi:hypothetical protein
VNKNFSLKVEMSSINNMESFVLNSNKTQNTLKKLDNTSNIFQIKEFCKSNNIPITAVKCSPHYDEKKGRVSKGSSICNKDWKTKGRFELNKFNTEPHTDNKPTMWIMSLKHCKMFVIDIDVKQGKTAKDIIKENLYEGLLNSSQYVVQTGSNGLHLYFKIPESFNGTIKNYVDVEDCKAWFKEEEIEYGSVDIIMDAIITEGSSYIFNNVKYSYNNIKIGTTINDVSECEQVWDVMCKHIFQEDKLLTTQQPQSSEVIQKEIDDSELIEHLNNIPNNDMKWDDWYEMGQLIFNIYGPSRYELFNDWSAKSNKYNPRTTMELWRRLKNRQEVIIDGERKTKKKRIGSLLYLSKQSNKEQYEKIRKNYFEKRLIPSHVIIDDKYACETFISLMNNDIVRQGDTVYIYNTQTGIWSNTETSILTAIHTLSDDLIFRQKEANGKILVYNYGGKVKNINNMLKLLVPQLPQSNFIENNCFKNKECLLFKNGWFDMGSMKFHIGFDGCREKVFTHRILRNFTEKRDINLERHIKKTLFENPYNNNKIGEFYMNGLARAIAGCITDKVYWNVVGNPNCGKGILTKILKVVFDEYVDTFNLNTIKFNKINTDEAKKLAWTVPLIGKRIVIANEVAIDGKPLDGNLMKTLSGGGDELKGRLNHRDEIKYTLQATFFNFVNDIPKIVPCDQALKNRMECIPHTKSFVNKKQIDCNQYEMEADAGLADKVITDEWINSFFWLIMDAYGPKLPKPEEVVNESNELFIVEDVALKVILEEQYEFVPTSKLEAVKEDDKPDNCVRFSDISIYVKNKGIYMTDTKLGKELKKIGLVKDDLKINKKKCVVYFGLKE